MRVLNPLRNVSTITIKTLKKLYGVKIRVYEPAVVKESIDGHQAIVYRDEPTEVTEGLCPAYFKYRDYLGQTSMLDPFQENPEILLWTDIQKPFKLYSKVIFDTDYTGVTSFKIIMINTESDEQGNFIHKHSLVPIYENIKAHNLDQIKKDIYHTENIAEFTEDRDTTVDTVEPSKYGYQPIR